MKKIIKIIVLTTLSLLAVATILQLTSIIPAKVTMQQIEDIYHQTDSITLFQCTGDKKELISIHDQSGIDDFFQTLTVQPTIMQLFKFTCFSPNDYGIRIFKNDGTKVEIMHLDTGGILRSKIFPWGEDVCLKQGSADRLARWLCKHGAYRNKESNQILDPTWTTPVFEGKV
ncbi:hypothetical protein [Pontiella agarivorans]|uniref:TNase-like domain-containing protein n=1 Tax=Pontiella agarivorans TaxID=3038953 RepID=A0ABU5MRZ5_9BACT|nr:hypothetical protein [Pontiella agarivorans]MDZ8116994.1 hypothetical protein [Pontiella agarivorans]